MEQITDKEFILIKDYMKKNYGINLTYDKKSLVYSRLKNTLDNGGFKNFMEYYKYLSSDKTGKASMIFIDKMSTNHTFFMREIDHFEFFINTVLPKIEERSLDKDIRVWCAGCSSGEESYTLGILISEYFKNKEKWNKEILATDISTVVLKKAIRGIYTKQQIKPLDPNWKEEYFDEISTDKVIVKDEIKKNITYRKFNLMEKILPFKKKFQVIFCRNVMIYFDDPTREKLIKKFYDASEKGSYLFIGHAETLNNIETEYEYVMPAIYYKK